MRKTIILNLALVLILGSTAQADMFSSKATFSKSAHPIDSSSDMSDPGDGTQGRLARITAYWPGEDYYTNHKRSASGVRLRDGYCAVDSSIIPYGSLVEIPGVGNYVAVDTGTAVISRKAAKESGHTRAERNALVIDLYFASRRAGELFSEVGPKFALIAWEPGGTRVASN
jgi:3D (Asp-Asp-Asp) domain-containing protein